MRTVTARTSRKVPIPGLKFGMMEFSAEVSVDMAADEPDTITAKLDEMYEALSSTIKARIADECRAAEPPPETKSDSRRQKPQKNVEPHVSTATAPPIPRSESNDSYRRSYRDDRGSEQHEDGAAV